MNRCRICDHEATGQLKGIHLCDVHFSWAVDVFKAIKTRDLEQLPALIERLPIRKASEECVK
jgi:hypothetical protein